MPDIFEKYRNMAEVILRENWTGSYTRPAPHLYPHQWNWDSGFIAMGKAHYDPAEAAAEMDHLFQAQWKNGMLPQIIFDPDSLGNYFPEPDFWQADRSPHCPDGWLTSGITMPPVQAIAVEKIRQAGAGRAEIREFTRKIYPKLCDLHAYLYSHRDPQDTGLVYIRHPWESGIDNSPAWDAPLNAIDLDKNRLPSYRRKDLGAVSAAMRPSNEDYDRYVFLVDLFRRLDYDEESIRKECPFLILDPLFNSVLCRANQSLARLAELLGEDPARAREWEHRTSEGIRATLWCPGSKQFFPYDLVSGDLIRAVTSSGFLPLYGGAASQEQAGLLYERLDTISFCRLHQGNCYTVPNYDTQAEGFDRANYWRGPVWVNINWMLAEGLARYGFTLKADSLRRDLLQLPIRFGFYEYFDSFSGKGYGSENFSWTAALFIDLLEGFYSRSPEKRSVRDLIGAAFTPPLILNSGDEEPACPLDELAKELMKSISGMRDAFYDTERGLVDYDALGNSEHFREYRTLANGLRRFDPASLRGREEQLAFWINLYNTLVVDGIVTFDVHRSVQERAGFFRKVKYNIGGRNFSLDDMEHGILRGNRRGPYSFLPPIPPWDGRRHLVMGHPDPRVHFALVCGSRSCAPIEYYTADRIDDQLDEAARSFINSSEVMVFPEENRVLLSEIFKWYERDFEGKSGIIDFIRRYHASEDVVSLLPRKKGDFSFEYLFYDWNLNRWGR